MTILIILISAGLIITALVILFSTTEKAPDKKIDLFPRRVTDQTANRTTTFNSRLLARYMIIFFLVLTTLFYIRENMLQDRATVVLNKDNRLVSLTKEQYQTICLETLKPALEQAAEYRHTDQDPDEIHAAIAKRFAKPSGDALKTLCMAAENRYDTYREEKFFQE